MGRRLLILSLTVAVVVAGSATLWAGESWLQLKFDARHSGDVPGRSVGTPLGLVGAVPLTDAVFTAPVCDGRRIYVVDGSGVAFALDADTLRIVWKFASRGGAANCNNVSSPALVGGYLHFGTTAGTYYVLRCDDGTVAREIPCGEPIFSAPVVAGDRVYFATVGARVHAVSVDGTPVWSWDFVPEILGFSGDRWSGDAWRREKGTRVTWRDHFCCTRNIAVTGKTIVVPAGGRTVFLDDTGPRAELRAVGLIPDYHGNEFAATLGQSIGADGAVYVQWHRRDNAGRVEILRCAGKKVTSDYVRGTETAIEMPGLMSFCSASLRDGVVYRCRPEEGFGCSAHLPGSDQPRSLGGYPSIAPPILLRDNAVYGGLDGRLYVAALSGHGTPWSFKTAFGKAITAPVAVCDGRIIFGGEDGYLYVLGPDGKAPLPTKELSLERVRSPLEGSYAAAKYDWFTNYGDMANTNSNDQQIRPPLKIKWMRRYKGTFKHLPVCGGGRMYTHTAEGQIFAVEQETGRLLWRRYWPGVHLSFTAPLYYQGRLIVPQAGLKGSWVRCLDAATGRLMWEAPFTGSPSWSRQEPPVIYKNLVIYASGSGKYAPQGTETAYIMQGEPRPSADGADVMSWIYTHNNPYYPRDNRPLIWAWDLQTGKPVWQKDFSEHGSGGNDCGFCLMDDTLYYSTFFGYSAGKRKRRGYPPGPNGITAALDPASGAIEWLTTRYSVTAGCTISAKDGRLYLGGYNQPEEGTSDRYVFCLDAKDGSLVWRSEPVRSAVNVISLGERFLFSNASGNDGHVLDRATGKILSRFNLGYACTRFSCSEPYVLGANMDMIDLSQDNQLVSTGPCIDSRECVGATVSNGRIFYTSQASGFQVSLLCGAEAESFQAPWEASTRPRD
jgi:outer membrane protein assembly factor BamB